MKFAILSDIHANYTALQAVLQRLDWLSQAQGEGFQLRFLGDLVGYGPIKDALQCIRWLRFAPQAVWIPGNHDEWILHPNGGVRFEARVTLLSQRLFLQRLENQGDWEWFAEKVASFVQNEQPLIYQDLVDDYRLGYSHASIMPGQERSAYLFPWQPPLVELNLSEFRTQNRSESFCLFFGHTHFPMLARLAQDELKFSPIKYGQPIDLGTGPVAINPGSVGQPRDGDPRTSFAVLDTDNHSITFYRADYNILEVRERLISEQNINQIDHPHEHDLNHPLTREERKELTRQLGLDGKNSNAMAQILKAYQSLDTSLETGDGGENTVNFGRIYRRPRWDLEV